MTAFTKHPHSQGVTYFEHLWFAIVIAWRLWESVTAFAIHALLPFIPIDRRLDLEATAAFLTERNQFIEAAAEAGQLSTNTVKSDSQLSSVSTVRPVT